MIKDAEQYVDVDMKVMVCVDANDAFEGYLHSMRAATKAQVTTEVVSKEKKPCALKDGQSWSSEAGDGWTSPAKKLIPLFL